MKGFTLLETIISIGILTLLSTGAFVSYRTMQRSVELDLAEDSIRGALRFARMKSLSGSNDSSWSILIQNQEGVVFEGNDFNNRNLQADRRFTISKDIDILGDGQVNFNKLSGAPDGEFNIIIKNAKGEKNISINEKGFIE